MILSRLVLHKLITYGFTRVTNTWVKVLLLLVIVAGNLVQSKDLNTTPIAKGNTLNVCMVLGNTGSGRINMNQHNYI